MSTIPWYRRPMRRSVMTAHREIEKDQLRQIDRLRKGRYPWCPKLRAYIAKLQAETSE